MATEKCSRVLVGICVLYVASSINNRAVEYSIYRKNIIHSNPWRVNIIHSNQTRSTNKFSSINYWFLVRQIIDRQSVRDWLTGAGTFIPRGRRRSLSSGLQSPNSPCGSRCCLALRRRTWAHPQLAMARRFRQPRRRLQNPCGRAM